MRDDLHGRQVSLGSHEAQSKMLGGPIHNALLEERKGRSTADRGQAGWATYVLSGEVTQITALLRYKGRSG